MTGLADCNNFFVSCERTVDPALEGKAVVVGSNNDGCVVARSNEAKALGVKMGQPLFELRNLLGSGHLIAISGNHLLYREISLNIHSIFRRFVPNTIDYSVDEAFLDMKGIDPADFIKIGHGICDACWNEQHIPVTIGFSHTKTLAKVITELTKKNRGKVGVMIERRHIEDSLDSLPISELWGIGRRLSKRLYQEGIHTIGEFSRLDKNRIRTMLGVNGERSWLELHGIDCIELSHIDRGLQTSISETRTFPEDVSDPDYLRARIAIYAADCAKKLRAQKGLCRRVTVFLRTNRFHPERGVHRPSATVSLPSPSSDTTLIATVATDLFATIYSSQAAYKRAGVILDELMPVSGFQRSLFDFEESPSRTDPEKVGSTQNLNPSLARVLDSLNKNVGKPVVKLASQLVKGHPGHNDGYSSSFQSPKR